ncbi:MAG TPA: AMP-binding protein [Actinomycetota bacterium]|nr:AMP-binding protein [Actinomycetota bacterium]
MHEATGLWELLEARVAATPDDEAVIDEQGRRMTFAELRTSAERVAAGLAGRGVGKETVVSWQLPTWIESMTLVAALSRLEAIQNPIIPIYREREVGFIAQQADSRLLIVPSTWRDFDYEAMAKGIAEDSDNAEVLVADRELPEGDPSTLPPPPPPPMAAADAPVRWLFYTSGTTAEPKGAQHTDATIMAIGRGMSDRLAMVPDDRNALCFPFTHIGGIVWLFSSLLVGFVNLIDEAFDPVRTTEFLNDQGVTVAGSGTFFHMGYLKYAREHPDTTLFANVRCYPGGGAPKPPQLHYDLKKEIGGVGIVSGYGLTEAPILTMASVEDSDEVLANTEGHAMPDVQLKLVTLDGAPAGPGEEGEIRAKAPQLMRGYLDSALDMDAFDEEGFFRTGDLGRLDEAGNVTITGRVKDIIIRKGENISAKEVEDLLFRHDKVVDVAVIGLPDAERGEMACAVIVAGDGDRITLEEMGEYLTGSGLRIQAVPERLEFVDALPRNPAGKIVKNELRQRFTS